MNPSLAIINYMRFEPIAFFIFLANGGLVRAELKIRNPIGCAAFAEFKIPGQRLFNDHLTLSLEKKEYAIVGKLWQHMFENPPPDVGSPARTEYFLNFYDNLPAPEFREEYEILLGLVREGVKRGPKGSGKSNDALVVEKVTKDVKARGYPHYSDILLLFSAISDTSVNSNPLFTKVTRWNYDTLAVPLPVRTGSTAHLGFKTINDLSSAGVLPVEVSGLPYDTKLHVDGNVYSDMSVFTAHDLQHAEETIFADFRPGVEGIRGAKSNFEANAAFMNDRRQRYGMVRAYIDNIADRRRRMLAEAVWFSLDHEFHVAYRNKDFTFAYSPIRNYGTERFTTSSAILDRLHRDGDLGQAFKNSKAIQESEVVEILRDFEIRTGINYQGNFEVSGSGYNSKVQRLH